MLRSTADLVVFRTVHHIGSKTKAHVIEVDNPARELVKYVLIIRHAKHPGGTFSANRRDKAVVMYELWETVSPEITLANYYPTTVRMVGLRTNWGYGTYRRHGTGRRRK